MSIIDEPSYSRHFMLTNELGIPNAIWVEEIHGLPGNGIVPTEVIEIPHDDIYFFTKEHGKWKWENDQRKAYIKPVELVLQQAKTARKAAINDARDAAELEPFTYLGKQFDADALAVKRITLAVQAAQSAVLAKQTYNLTWTCADNTTLDLTETQIVTMPIAMAIKGNEIHTKARTLKAAIDAATTVEEIDSITW